MEEARAQANIGAKKPIDVPRGVQKQAEKLVERVAATIRRVEAEEFRKWAVWEKQYDGRLPLPDVIRQDANLDIPLTREFVRQLIARLINPIFQYDRIFIAKPRRPGYDEDASAAEQLLDYITDQTTLYEACIEWVRQAMVYPVGVVKVRFIPPRYESVKRTEVQEDGMRAVVETRVLAEDAKATVEPVPPVHFFAAPGASSVDSAEWVCHRIIMSAAEIKRKIEAKEYAPVFEEIRGGGEADEPAMDASSIADSDGKAFESEHDDWFKVLEIYFRADVGGEPREFMMLAEQNSGKILQLTENPFFEHRRPFVTFTYEEIPGSLFGMSAAKILEPIHRAYSASVNLRLIAAAKANNVAVVVPKGSGAKQLFPNGIVKPGVWELDLPIGGKASDVISTFNISQPFSHLPQLEELLMTHAQKLLALTDYNFGLEQIQRPTATGQVQLIQEGKQALYNLLERFRRKLARVAEIMVARYVQYFPDGLTLYLATADGETKMRTVQLTQWPKGILERHVLFEPKVSSQSMNKEMRKQEKLALADKLPQVYQFMMTLAQQAAMPSPMAGVAQKLLIGYQQAVAEWMEEFDVPNLEAVVPDVSQDTNAVQNVMAFFQNLQAQMANGMAAAAPGGGGLPGGGGGSGLPGEMPPGAVPPGMAPPPQGPEGG